MEPANSMPEVTKYQGYQCSKVFLLDSDICLCVGSDNTDINNLTYTFYSKTGSSSFIDHVFCNQSIKSDIVSVRVIDSGDNTSDHLPLTWKLSCSFKTSGCNSANVNMTYPSDMMLVYDDNSVLRYKNAVDEELDRIQVPFCHDKRAHGAHSEHSLY